MYRLTRFGAWAVVTMLAASPVEAQTSPPVTRLSLPEAVNMAVARNQALQAQRTAVDAARADEITAGLKPNLSVSFGADGFTRPASAGQPVLQLFA